MADILNLRKMYALDGTGDSNAGVGSNRGMYDHLFEPGPMPTPDMPIPEESGLSAYQPETAASSRLQQLLGEYPERQDPSFARKITAMLGGLSTLGRNANNGIDIQDKILQGPNDQRISDWEKKIRPAEVASTQENQRNVNSRSLAALEQRERIEGRKQTEVERKNQANEEIRQQNADLQALKYQNPDLKFDFSGPKVVITNPRDGSVKITNYDTGKVTEATKLNAAQQRAETMAAGQTARAQLAADTSLANTETAGSVVLTDAKSNLPVVVRSRAGVPEQLPVKNATPVTRVPGQAGPSKGPELARVRGMSKEALDLIKSKFLIMPDPKNPKGVPTINPAIKVGSGWKNWDPQQILPESPQRAAINLQLRLKNILTLGLIGEMKEQSKTGATGFGQLTGRELNVLEAAASTLDWSQDDATLTDELIRIVEKLEKIMQPGEGEENVSTLKLESKFRQNRTTGEQQVSTDGGKTWKPYVKPQ